MKILVGNAYVVWKASGLKHYPTVLKALKKLEKAQFVEVSTKGRRGEKQFVPTMIGVMILHSSTGRIEKDYRTTI
jgi:DNA-binding PadR family transcriptional regulator